MIVKSTLNFPVFSVGRNKYKFVICLRVKVFMCNILIEYSAVHPEWTLKHDYSEHTYLHIGLKKLQITFRR